MYPLQIKRVYVPAEETDGQRILVDRLWPRGISKEKLALTSWNKSLAPSQALCKALANKQSDFSDFSEQYYNELDANEAAHDFLSFISEEIKTTPVTLLYASKDEKNNHAALLKTWLQQKLIET